MHALPAGRILLAFSGGPDSVGLAARLRDARPLLAYVDHRLRGPRAGRDERRRVREAARRLGLPLVRARLALAGPGEEAARAARYRVLHALARKHGAILATAHTADDRAETILFNLARGTGLRGLAAPRRAVRIGGVLRVRPALDERRASLRDAASPYAPARDRSNRDTGRARSRLRTVSLPALARRLGEDPVPLLCAIGAAAAAVRGDLERRARRLAADAARTTLLEEPGACFPYLVEALRRAGPPLTARAYGSLLDFLRAGRRDRAHVTPGGDTWRLRRDGTVAVSSPAGRIRPSPARTSAREGEACPSPPRPRP